MCVYHLILEHKVVAWLNVQFTQLLLKAIKSNKILCVRVRDSISDSGSPAALGPSGGLFPLSLGLGRSKARDGECPGFLLFTPFLRVFPLLLLFLTCSSPSTLVTLSVPEALFSPLIKLILFNA